MSTERKLIKDFTESIMPTLGSFLMRDPEGYVAVHHGPTEKRKEYSTYLVTIDPTAYPNLAYEVEIFKRTLERMRVLQYSRGAKYIIASLKQKTNPDDYDEVILSLGNEVLMPK